MAIYVVKINPNKGTVTVADAKLASDNFTVLGEEATTSSGERPTKFSAGTEVSKDIKFGDKVDKSDSDSLLYFVEAK